MPKHVVVMVMVELSLPRVSCRPPEAVLEPEQTVRRAVAVRFDRSTNPNPKVRKSGAVGKAVLASMVVLEEGSIRAARGGSHNYICTWLVNGPGGFRTFEEQKKPAQSL